MAFAFSRPGRGLRALGSAQRTRRRRICSRSAALVVKTIFRCPGGGAAAPAETSRQLVGRSVDARLFLRKLPALSAPVAQLDRASDYGSEGLKFESSRVRIDQEDFIWRNFSHNLALSSSERLNAGNKWRPTVKADAEGNKNPAARKRVAEDVNPFRSVSIAARKIMWIPIGPGLPAGNAICRSPFPCRAPEVNAVRPVAGSATLELE
jgi:hypothetical protein